MGDKKNTGHRKAENKYGVAFIFNITKERIMSYLPANKNIIRSKCIGGHHRASL